MKKGQMTYTSVSADEAVHKNYEDALAKLELGKSYPIHVGEDEIFSLPQFEVRAPFDTTILIAKFPVSSPVLIRSAITIAKNAFPAWEEKGWVERASILKKTARILERETYSLAALITCEAGKTREEALAEVGEAVAMIRYHVGIYSQNKGFVKTLKAGSDRETCKSVMRPYGIWAVISPFNFPLALVTGMASAALLCGNTVILKPASAAPVSCLRLYQAFIKAGIPSGAVHFLTGPGDTFGEIVTAHPDIEGIAFTGSRDAGIRLRREFSERQPNPKPLVAEMGSKNPVIVTAHADLDKAAEGVIRSAFGYGGQKCSAAARVYVHHEVYKAFLKALKDRTAILTIADPRKRSTFSGPLIDAGAVNRFRDIIIRTRRDGGNIITGGVVLTGKQYGNGHFVQPTIATGLPRGHPYFRSELFVPFLIVEEVQNLEEAVQEANDTDFGLTAGIFSEDEQELNYFFSSIRSGVTYANRRGGATTGAWPGLQPFGGWKASGSTGKGVGGPWYLHSYLREQSQTRVS